MLAVAAELLVERIYTEISIDDLASGAGISRPTFYFYFASKEAVLLALLDQLVRSVEEGEGSRALRGLAQDPALAWGRWIGASYETFKANAHLAAACAELRSKNSEIASLWSRVVDHWAEATAQGIRAERNRGTAPDGLSAKDLAMSLILMNERVLTAVFMDEASAINDKRVLRVLTTTWLRAIYAADIGVPGSR